MVMYSPFGANILEMRFISPLSFPRISSSDVFLSFVSPERHLFLCVSFVAQMQVAKTDVLFQPPEVVLFPV